MLKLTSRAIRYGRNGGRTGHIWRKASLLTIRVTIIDLLNKQMEDIAKHN